MMMTRRSRRLPINLVLLALSCCPQHDGGQPFSFATALSTTFVKQRPSSSIARRDALSSIAAIGACAAFLPAPHANAAEDNVVLTDEEMAARVARKMDLLRGSKSGGPTVRATDVRSDVNPEAAANLRSRSAVENARIAMEKQREMKNRDTAQKREDLCEMLGR